ncbi:MAG TPA: M42 family metallopeptidase [Firmicutes bacterium]|nr:M42 family metallopeptidase [Bacillota bacterium]
MSYNKHDLHRFLKELTENDGASGYEENIASIIADAFSPYVDEQRKDNLGNLIFLKRGMNTAGPKVFLCAHMDEIGLMITKVEDNGFLRFTSLGGFDPRTLPGQEVVIRGQSFFEGIIGTKPPHLIKGDEKGKGAEMEELFIDTGLPETTVRKEIKIGSVAVIKRKMLTLLNGCLAGKALDDRAGIAVLWVCARELVNLNHQAEIYLVATVQEEVGTRGALVSTFGVSPDVGIAVDVCHGDFPGAQEYEVSQLGKGPVITWGPNIHPQLAERLTETAKEYHLPHQKDVSPGPTGTDARAIQVSLGGIPTALLSIPLRYMHTSVELVNPEDIKVAGKLLAFFLADLDGKFVEGLSCI